MMMIGGEHYLKHPHSVPNSMGDVLVEKIGRISFFSTGRDALFSLLAKLPEGTIYLPDLMCHSVYAACRAAGKQVESYRITPDLLNSDFSEKRRNADSCVLVMHYFGIPNHHLVSQAKEQGLNVISDVTHMLFNEEKMQGISEESDYLIASLRKSGPFPDGGFISSRFHPVTCASQQMRVDFHSLRAAGLLSRGFSAGYGYDDDENFRLLKRAEELIDNSPPGDHQCSYLTRRLLRTIDLHGSAERMRQNVAVLAEALNGLCQTVNTPESPSPYFYCRFNNRDERDKVRIELAKQQVFCPIHWDTSQMPVPSPLSELTLSIPCDSRYNATEMQLIAKIIRSCLKL